MKIKFQTKINRPIKNNITFVMLKTILIFINFLFFINNVNVLIIHNIVNRTFSNKEIFIHIGLSIMVRFILQ